MMVKEIAAVAALTAALVGSGGTSASGATAGPVASTSATVASTCLASGHADAWPAWTEGRPTRDPGVTLWHNAQGWHVRVTHNTLRDRVFSGEIKTRGTLVNVHAVRLEHNDYLQVAADGHTLRFRFNNYGGIDGFDFATHCAPALAFGFLSNGLVVGTSHISIGAAGRHPASDPFVIARRS
jgi:hypothetical protein